MEYPPDEKTPLDQPRMGGQLTPKGHSEIVLEEKIQNKLSIPDKKRVAVGKLVDREGRKVIQITSDPAFRKSSSSQK